MFARYFAIYRIMFRNSLIRDMSFKASFLLWLAVGFLWFLGQIFFVQVIFGQVDRIGDWTKWEVVLLVAVHQLVSELFQAIFFVNLANIPELVRTGKMDSILQLPADSQFLVSVKQFGLDNLLNAGIGLGFALFALAQMRVMPSAGQWLLFGFVLIFGVVAHYCVMFFLVTLSFWIVRAQGVVYGYFNMFNISRFPDVIFTGVFRFVFSWIIPVILVANVPTRVLAHAGVNPWGAIAQLVAVGMVSLVATRLFWLHALKRYSSASS